jgi:hypothetical protein
MITKYEKQLKQSFTNDEIPYIKEYVDTILSEYFDTDEILKIIRNSEIKIYNDFDFNVLGITEYALCDFDELIPGVENRYDFYKSKDGKYVLELETC